MEFASDNESEQEIHYSSEEEQEEMLEEEANSTLDSADELDTRLEQVEQELKQVPFEQLLMMKQKIVQKEQSKPKEIPKLTKSGSGPVEMTAKKQVSRYRNVVQPVKKKIKDPRFEEQCGTLNMDLYKRSYGFVEEMQAKEAKELQEKLKKTKDPQLKQELKTKHAKMVELLNKNKRQEKKQEIIRNWKKQDSELVRQGKKKPFFLKKSEVRKMELIERYKEFGGDSKKLDKFIEKKRKKNAAKEHKQMPFRRQQE